MNQNQLKDDTNPRSVDRQQACSPAVVCRECGPTCKYGEGDEIRLAARHRAGLAAIGRSGRAGIGR